MSKALVYSERFPGYRTQFVLAVIRTVSDTGIIAIPNVSIKFHKS